MECAAASAETEGADAAQETMTAPSRGGSNEAAGALPAVTTG